MQFIKNITKYHFHSQKEFEVEKREEGNNSQKNTLGVFCAMFFKQEIPLRLKIWHEVLGSYIQISKNNNAKYNVTSVCTIKTTL